jgi:predicted TIM-barrel fold metal-dependent hydrolase
MNKLIFLALTILLLSLASFSQALSSSSVPIADHHMHIWSLQASQLVTEPLPPKVELPAELDKLLRDKERLSKQRSVDAIRDLYTGDLVALDAGAPMWLQGDRAIHYIAESTVMNTLLPTAFSVNGNEGYIAGTEVSSDSTQTPLSDFLYVIRKGADGKWRIAVESFTMTGPPLAAARTADQLIAGMDAAGVKKASVLSVAYWFGNPRRNVQDQYPKVRAENDWILDQASKYPGRLYPFFSFNPLSDYALAEIERCAKIGKFAGIKLHIGNSRIDMLNPEHVAKLKAVFAAANKYKLPIVIHLWTSDPKYGAPHSKAFLEQVLPAAPDIPIQIAHMAASGPGYSSDDAMEVFASAGEHGDPRMKNVYFDVASDVIATSPQSILDIVTRRLRQVGMSHVLFGSDWSPGSGNEEPGLAWRSFRRLPLTEAEFRTVANNVAPYLK